MKAKFRLVEKALLVHQLVLARRERRRKKPRRLMAELLAAKRPGRCAFCDGVLTKLSPNQVVHARCRWGWDRLYWRALRAEKKAEREARGEEVNRTGGVASRYSVENRAEMRGERAAGATLGALARKWRCSRGYVCALLRG